MIVPSCPVELIFRVISFFFCFIGVSGLSSIPSSRTRSFYKPEMKSYVKSRKILKPEGNLLVLCWAPGGGFQSYFPPFFFLSLFLYFFFYTHTHTHDMDRPVPKNALEACVVCTYPPAARTKLVECPGRKSLSRLHTHTYVDGLAVDDGGRKKKKGGKGNTFHARCQKWTSPPPPPPPRPPTVPSISGCDLHCEKYITVFTSPSVCHAI